MRPDLPPRLPNRAALDGLVAGMEIDDLPGGFAAVVTPETTVATDPHFGMGCDRAAAVYAPGPSGSLLRRVVVHFEPDDAEPARRAARLTGRLLHLHQRRFGRPAPFPRDVDAADLWLFRSPAADPRIGGETRTNNVYVWDTGAPRTDAEWARTLCHEWGHLTLSAARGYAAPEGDAGGFLGEALYLAYLRGEPDSRADDFVRRADLDAYHARRNAPRIERFLKAGPADRTLDRRDAEGMDYYIGGALASDAAFGSTLLAKALRGIDSEEPRELFASLRRALTAEREMVVALPAWVPFAADRYAIAARQGAGLLAIDRERPVAPRPDRPVTIAAPAWRFLRAASGDLKTITLRRLRG